MTGDRPDHSSIMTSTKGLRMTTEDRLTGTVAKLKSFFWKVDHNKCGKVDKTIFVEMLRLHNLVTSPSQLDDIKTDTKGHVNYKIELANILNSLSFPDRFSSIDWERSSIATTTVISKNPKRATDHRSIQSNPETKKMIYQNMKNKRITINIGKSRRSS